MPTVYDRCLLGHPKIVLVALFAALAFFAWHARDFRLDASADSLLLEGDADLEYFRQVQDRYASRDLLIVTFTPEADLFSEESLKRLRSLRDELRAVEGVDAVTSLLDVPLLRMADVPITEIADHIRRLEEPGVDRARARAEILESPVYRDLLVSPNARTTAVLLDMRATEGLRELQRERGDLRAARRAGTLDEAQRARLRAVEADYDGAKQALDDERHRDVAAIRAILERYRPYGTLHLGGVPMITDDMIAFIRSDLVAFGAGVLVFLVVVLGLIFGQRRWVLLPLLSCFFAGLVMVGLLGLIGWKVTVISSNFLALMLIITMSMNIHLAVRYRQLRREFPDAEHRKLVSLTVRRMVWPCLFTALTTIIGFSSLVFSDIKPVIDFGWMMSVGLGVTFLTSFTLFPAVLVLLGKTEESGGWRRELPITESLATLTERHGNAVLAISVGLAALSAVGISRLTVENSFVDYFRKGTEIYQGLRLIDWELGGTTPLEILLDMDEDRIFADPGSPEARVRTPAEIEADGVDVDEKAKYWFTPFKVERIKAVHDYLEGLPEVGKVLSFASVLRVGEALNDDKEFDSLQLALIYRRIPPEIRESLIDPYLNVRYDEARIRVRVRDTREDLRRKELLDRIRTGIRDELGIDEAHYKVSGLLVLYNNMLQSLYTSQISTFGVVMAGVGVTFLLLFRSISLSIIGLIPNVLAAAIILGVMGLAGIPLDMMTITIAAITIGIAVDNSIHYIYRFREEFARSGDYVATLHVCHATIAKGILYTSITIIFGFSILVLSNFIPTIYFGVFTGLAMLIALLAALTVLPKLLLLWKPFPQK